MSLIAISQVLGLLLSGYLAQRLGIRSVFMACAGFLGVISAAGYFVMRGRPAVSTPGGTPVNAGSRSTAAGQQS
jgi:hypothetical protein